MSEVDASSSSAPATEIPTRKLRIAIAGCSHGEMDKIYGALAQMEYENNYKIDLLICCGDYQAVRNYGDLAHMHVPDKYKSLQTFYRYYSGEKVAPILTLFVGGNHEASGYLSELPNGGWVAPSIYYLGFSSVIRFAGLRIGGLSGIYKHMDFGKGHFERPPYHGKGELISAYHVRSIDVWRLKQLRSADDDFSSNPVDIMVSHDWPAGISAYGDERALLRKKPFFREDVEKGQLGNMKTLELLKDVRPRFWFSAHLHCMFPAEVPHEAPEGVKAAASTRFLALDKPLPNRQFLRVIDVDVPQSAELEFSYDPEWLAILKNTDSYTNVSRQVSYLPSSSGSTVRWDFRPSKEEIDSVLALGDLHIPKDFYRTAPPIIGYPNNNRRAEASLYYRNPQSTRFCQWLGIKDLNGLLADLDPTTLGIPHYVTEGGESADANEICLDDEDFGDDDFVLDVRPSGIEHPVVEEPAPAQDEPPSLDNFEAPRWRGNSTANDSETTATEGVFKRRKVDFNEDAE